MESCTAVGTMLRPSSHDALPAMRYVLEPRNLTSMKLMNVLHGTSTLWTPTCCELGQSRLKAQKLVDTNLFRPFSIRRRSLRKFISALGNGVMGGHHFPDRQWKITMRAILNNHNKGNMSGHITPTTTGYKCNGNVVMRGVILKNHNRGNLSDPTINVSKVRTLADLYESAP